MLTESNNKESYKCLVDITFDEECIDFPYEIKNIFKDKDGNGVIFARNNDEYGCFKTNGKVYPNGEFRKAELSCCYDIERNDSIRKLTYKDNGEVYYYTTNYEEIETSCLEKVYPSSNRKYYLKNDERISDINYDFVTDFNDKGEALVYKDGEIYKINQSKLKLVIF